MLLGIVEEGSGVAISVLKALNVDPQKIHLEVEKIVQRGPDEVTIGRLPLTPRAKKVIEYAMEEAHSFKHEPVGTEHLLLGLVHEWDGVAAQVLYNRDVTLDDVRGQVAKLVVREPPTDSQPWSFPDAAPRSAARALGRLVGRVAMALGLGRWVG